MLNSRTIHQSRRKGTQLSNGTCYLLLYFAIWSCTINSRIKLVTLHIQTFDLSEGALDTPAILSHHLANQQLSQLAVSYRQSNWFDSEVSQVDGWGRRQEFIHTVIAILNIIAHCWYSLYCAGLKVILMEAPENNQLLINFQLKNSTIKIYI